MVEHGTEDTPATAEPTPHGPNGRAGEDGPPSTVGSRTPAGTPVAERPLPDVVSLIELVHALRDNKNKSASQADMIYVAGLRRKFQEQHGWIEDAYFGSELDSACLHVHHPVAGSRLYVLIPSAPSVYDWVTELLLECHGLSIEVRQVLQSDSARQICIERLFFVTSQLLRLLDDAHGEHPWELVVSRDDAAVPTAKVIFPARPWYFVEHVRYRGRRRGRQRDAEDHIELVAAAILRRLEAALVDGRLPADRGSGVRRGARSLGSGRDLARRGATDARRCAHAEALLLPGARVPRGV